MLEAVLQNCSVSDAEHINVQLVEITDDAGSLIASFSGFSPMISVSETAAGLVVTFRVTASTTARKVNDLQQVDKQLTAGISLLQQQQTFLEDCLLEMADEVYA